MFPANVERWRGYARRWAAWADSLYHTGLNESDVLALIQVESGGNPTAKSKTGYRGLGQVGSAALTDYNNGVQDSLVVDYDWLLDPAHAEDQVRVVAWHLARGRAIVDGWPMADAKANANLWCDVRYAWGGGNLKKAVAAYTTKYGHPPTFAELELELPDAGKPNVRPWHHARRVAELSAADTGRGGAVPLPPVLGAVLATAKVSATFIGGAALLVGGVLLVVAGLWRNRGVR